MEAFIALFVLFLAWNALHFALRAGAGAFRAAARASAGKGSFTENFEAVFKGMGPLEVRIEDKLLGDSTNSLPTKELQVKGLFPVHSTIRVRFVTSVFDNTGGSYEPVICSMEPFQEAHTFAFQHCVDIGLIEPGLGLVGWVQVGTIIPQLLQPPYGGKRDFVAVLRLVSMDDPPPISRGFHTKDHPGIIWQRAVNFEYVSKEKGYLEAAEARNKARTLCLKIAVAIAMWDGALHDRDGHILKSWVQKMLNNYDGSLREQMKAELNQAMRNAYADALANRTSLLETIGELNEIDDVSVKYETMELCFDIMTTPSKHTEDRVRVIDLVSKALELDAAQLEKIRDAKIIAIDPRLTQKLPIEELLGIDVKWDRERIKAHLRAEFMKWNNRVTTLSKGEERDNAQKMLDAIAEARRKYG